MILSRLSLRTKVTVLLLGLSLGPLLISGIVHQNRAVASGKQAVRERYAQSARFAARAFDLRIEGFDRDVGLLATRFPVEALDLPAIARHLDVEGTLLPTAIGRHELHVFNALNEGAAQTFLALPDGRVFFSQPFHNVRSVPNLKAFPWFAKLDRLRGGTLLGDLPPFTVAGHPQLIALKPLFASPGVSTGYLGALLDPSVLQRILREVVREQSGARSITAGTELAALIDRDGQFAAHSHRHLVGTAVPPHLFGTRTTGTEEVQIGEERVILSRAEVGRSGWYVALQTPVHGAYREVYTLTWLLTVMIVLTFIFVLLFADHLATVLLRPVHELERGAEMIGAGALDYRIELQDHAHDELGRVAHAFNKMGGNLLRSRRQVEAYGRTLSVANLELDAMVFAITHDLKKSLRGIEGFATFLDEDYAPQLGRDGVEMIQSIVQNVHRIEKLADDLIGLVEHERERGERAGFPMDALLREDREHCLENLIGEVTIQPGMPEIIGDRVRLSLVFTNLISNGLKFNRSARPRVEITFEDLGTVFEFAVSDNGIGIDSRYHDHIFDLFSRLHAKDEYDGMGTGLNLARRIIEEHRGQINVESKPGLGSRFVVRVPKDPSSLTSPGFPL